MFEHILVASSETKAIHGDDKVECRRGDIARYGRQRSRVDIVAVISGGQSQIQHIREKFEQVFDIQGYKVPIAEWQSLLSKHLVLTMTVQEHLCLLAFVFHFSLGNPQKDFWIYSPGIFCLKQQKNLYRAPPPQQRRATTSLFVSLSMRATTSLC